MMKKLAVLTVATVMLFSLIGCTGATGDYTITEIDLNDAPQLILDQARAAGLERGHMVFNPDEHSELDGTYVLIVEEMDYDAIEYLEGEVDGAILRLTVDQKLNSDDVQLIDDHPVLLIKVDLNLDIALINDTDNIGYMEITPE